MVYLTTVVHLINGWIESVFMSVSRAMRPGAYVNEKSPYHDFFQFFEEGSWPYNAHYDGWWGNDTLPKLNYEGSEDTGGLYPAHCS